MVVDDTASMRAVAKKTLEDEYEVLCCEDGLDAIARITEFDPHLVLIDILMPRLDGYQAVALIRLNQRFKSIPVLMMSGKGGVFDIAKGNLLGFDGAIVKPFKAPDLLDAVKSRLLGKGPSG